MRIKKKPMEMKDVRVPDGAAFTVFLNMSLQEEGQWVQDIAAVQHSYELVLLLEKYGVKYTVTGPVQDQAEAINKTKDITDTWQASENDRATFAKASKEHGPLAKNIQTLLYNEYLAGLPQIRLGNDPLSLVNLVRAFRPGAPFFEVGTVISMPRSVLYAGLPDDVRERIMAGPKRHNTTKTVKGVVFNQPIAAVTPMLDEQGRIVRTKKGDIKLQKTGRQTGSVYFPLFHCDIMIPPRKFAENYAQVCKGLPDNKIDQAGPQNKSRGSSLTPA